EETGPRLSNKPGIQNDGCTPNNSINTKAIEEVQVEVRRKLPTEWKEIPLTIKRDYP
ncbi:9089_t:CDS:2, partial [Gigaspora rosea]